MATNTICDGTGVEIPEDTPPTGLFGRQYSEGARPLAEKYLEELNALHTAAAESFQAQLDALRARYRHLRTLPDA